MAMIPIVLAPDILAMAGGGVACVFLLAAALRGARRDARVQRRVALLRAGADASAIAAPGTPLIDALLLCVGRDRDEVAAALRAADYFHPRAVTAFALLRVAATIGGGCGAAMLLDHFGLLEGVGRLYPLGAAAAGFVLAKPVLRSRVNARTRQIGKELPFVLDLMLLMLESGVSLDQCFRHFAEWEIDAVPSTRRVMIALVDDLAKGMAFETAVERWADRMGVKGVRELAALFRQTMLHGTELTPSLRGFVREFAETRLSNAREVIGKKTTQMTMVMITFLMPALFIVIGGPAVTAVFETLSGMVQ